MTIHFVYSTMPGMRAFGRLRGKASRAGLPLSYVGDRERVDTASWPFRAPLSITHHLFQALKSLGRVRLYDWKERTRIRPELGDILIGHPYPRDSGRVWNHACLSEGFRARIALTPVHHGMPEICLDLDRYLPRCDRLLGITGPYWWDTWEQSALAHWKPKMTPVDMAINLAHYPRAKQRFNAPGKRRFLFIGNGEPYKGAHLLSILFGLAGTSCVWVGADRDFPHLAPRPAMTLAGAPLERLADECDVFLTMGVSDANPTTILEAMAWGFPVACTPQSGYHRIDELAMLSTTDMRHNLAVLERFQQAPEVELRAVADRARALVESRYGFDRMCATVLGEVRKHAGP